MNKDFLERVIRRLRLMLRIAFSRTAIIVVALLLQLFVFFASFYWLKDYSTVVYAAFVLLGAVTVVHILNEENNASFKIAWIIPVLVIPVFGTVLYIYINLQPGTKRIHKKLTKIEDEIRPYLAQNEETVQELQEQSAGEKGIADYLYHADNYPVYAGCKMKYYPIGEAKFADMIEQLKRAEHFIFMEYFIVAKGYVWDRVLEVLKRKAAEGVEVRFMYDGTCTVSLLPPNYPKKLEQEGIACRVFSPIRPALSTHQNNRDHRKIVVIDGKVAFTGGINLADEYVNRKIRFGHWKDTAIMLEGDAVRSFTLMFLEMWNVAKSEKVEEFDPYLDVIYEREKHSGEGFVIPYGDSPIDGEHVGKMVYMDILNTSKRYVHIMTPYLILDNEMMTALKFAAKRGVEVIIIMPHVPDKWYAFVLAKTYYNELLDAGVQIYEYTPGFVHAKVFTSDDRKAVVGTINMDYRSLYLHFECAAFLYENSEIPAVENDFQETLKKCQKITQEDYKKQKSFDKIAGSILRVFAPLM